MATHWESTTYQQMSISTTRADGSNGILTVSPETTCEEFNRRWPLISPGRGQDWLPTASCSPEQRAERLRDKAELASC